MTKPTQVWCGEDRQRALALASHLGLATCDEWLSDPEQQYLFYRDGALSLGLAPAAREHPVCVDFAAQQRNRHRGKELLLKAIGGRRDRLRVLDATAGLGRDSFLMASYGAEVTLCERQSVVAAMLLDGLERGRQDSGVSDVLARMHFVGEPAAGYLQRLSEGEQPDVIYLDPMFPESGKSALVKKEMRLFHSLVGRDDDADELLGIALQTARHRVVVKRPPKAPTLEGPAPQIAISGKAVRFDIYPLRAFSKS